MRCFQVFSATVEPTLCSVFPHARYLRQRVFRPVVLHGQRENQIPSAAESRREEDSEGTTDISYGPVALGASFVLPIKL